MVSSRRSLAVLAICTALTATGCGGEDSSAAPSTSPASSTAPVPVPSTPAEDPAADPGQMFTADPTIVGAHPISFSSWTRLAPDRLAVHFETGVPECYGVDATTTETETTVTVELRGGTRADATDKMCVMMAVFGTLEVPLNTPLGDRAVLSAV